MIKPYPLILRLLASSKGKISMNESIKMAIVLMGHRTHLPPLFLGMQHLQLNNVILADEYLNTAYTMCKADPLLLNELGVVCFHKQQLTHAIEWFNKALDTATVTGSKESAWVATHANLGHAYRKLKYIYGQYY